MKRVFRFVTVVILMAALAFAGAGCSKAARETRAYEKADKYFAEGDYDRAEVEYLNVMKLDHDAARACGRLGIMSFEQGRLLRAYSLLNHALKLDSNSTDVHIELGRFYLTSGGNREARKEALQVLAQHPDDPQAPMLLADSAVTLRDIETTETNLQSLNVPPAKRAPIETALGSLYLREHQPKQALAAFERARADDSKFGPLYAELGNYYVAQKDMKRAEEAYKYSAETAPIRSSRRMRYAQFKLQNNDLEGAKKLVEEVATKAPDYLPATIALANIAAGEKKFDVADKLTSKVLERDPQNFDALLLSARLGTLEDDPAKSVVEYEKLAKIFPRAAQVQYQLGLAYNAANDPEKAAACIHQALILNPNFVEAQMTLADLKMAKGDATAAITTLKDIVQKHPQMWQPQLSLAEAYRQQGQLENASAIYAKLEDAYPDNAQTPMYHGAVLLQLGQRGQARKEFEHSLQISPTYWASLEMLNELDMAEGQFSRAMQRVENAMKLTNAPEPTLLVAKIYLAQHDADKAIAVLKDTIKARPDYGQAYVMLGNLYTEIGQPQKNIELAREFLNKRPDDPAGLMQLALALDSQKDVNGAEQAYEKVLKYSPKNIAALNNLAFLYSEHGQTDKGLQFAKRAREASPFDPATADTLGWIYYREGDYPRAIVLIQESADKLPNSADVQYHLGMTRYMLGDESAARASLQYAAGSSQAFNGKETIAQTLSILSIDPNHPAMDAKALLEKRVAAQPGDPAALSRLATIYKNEGAVEKAIATYEAALKANPKNVQGLLALAQLYSAQPKQSTKAIALAKDAYKMAPETPGLSRLLGKLAYDAGDSKWSLTLLQDAARQGAPDADLLLNLALSSYNEGQVAEAIVDARTAMQTPGFPRSNEAKQFLDIVALGDDPSKAAASATQVEALLKAKPDYLPALVASGLIEEQKADARAATETFEKILAQYPDFTPAKRQLAVLYFQNGANSKSAADIAYQAHEAYPNDAAVTKALGVINYRMGDHTRAVRFLTDASSQNPNDADLLFYLGQAQYQLHQKTDSKKSLTRALDLNLKDPLATDARKTLALLK